MKKMLTIDETAALIAAGRSLAIAADEALLRALPRGAWIGGTIPYFMGDDGGRFTQERLYVDVLSDELAAVTITSYAAADLPRLPQDAYDDGFSIIILPAFSEAHLRFAQDGPDYQGMFLHPLVGWIAGVRLEDLGTITPKVFNGRTGAASDADAIVLHAQLAAGRVATIGIVNVFEQGEGDTLTFDEPGFSIGAVRANGGDPQSFAAYIRDRGVDTRLPLVADYNGAMINVSIQSVPDDDGAVAVYAPVFEGVAYRFAAPVEDYVARFTSAVPSGIGGVEFSCNCILNYLYSELEGKQTGDLKGPMTFGEVAYQLLNQTMVHLSVR